MSRRRAVLAVLGIWAAIFLPGLGSPEIKGEEGRRILPAIAMLDSGDWLVPQIGGEKYLRKPPLINWLIAASMKVTGARNEWAARLPSVLAVLALALVTLKVAEGWLGVETAFVAAVVGMTNIAMIEKGRLAEIEAVYVALTGIAIVCWVCWWARGKSRWLIWTVPFVFLGLAALAKGPVHLLFFYAVVAGVLFYQRRIRELFCWPHLAGIVIMTALFAAWAVPYFAATAKLGAAGVWSEQMRERVGGGDFDAGSYFLNIPRALSNFLPWLLLVPLWWKRMEDESIFKGLRAATAACFVVAMLIPGVLPRYTMPLFAPAALLTAMLLTRTPLPRGWKPARLALVVGLIACAAMILYALFVIPKMNERSETRALAGQINQHVPAGVELIVFDPGFQPALFYVRPPIRYIIDHDELPAVADPVLIREKSWKKLQSKWRGSEVRATLEDKGGRKHLIVALRDRKD